MLSDLNSTFRLDVPDGMTHLISNSEVGAFLQCERRHYYAHSLKIAPKSYSTSLSRGIVGHEVLAHYYSLLQEGVGPDLAGNESIAFLLKNFLGQIDNDLLLNLQTLLTRYFQFARNDDWEILEVEKQYEIAIPGGNFGYGMRLDLLIGVRSGPYAGERVLVDHKFVYDFKNDRDLIMDAQVPKYLGTLRANNVNVRRAMFNQIRHRIKKGPMTDDELFRREYVKPSSERIQNIMREQIAASERIQTRLNAGTEAYGKQALRTMNLMTCRNCSFMPVCDAELEGQDATLLIKTEYAENSYGYESQGDE